MLCRKANVFQVECVVRGYLAGSGWREYQKAQTVCGIPLPAGLKQCDRLPEPIFTPSTKAATGHDENISFEQSAGILGPDVARTLRDRSIAVYQKAAEYARGRGILIADTKFEWGEADGRIILVDEVLTPDSSRFWPADTYEPGHDQPSFDKQFLRNWLDTFDWNKTPPGPVLPDDIVAKTRAKYVEAYERLTGRKFA
jgi:phosphoribosylaminoimidazole-succinocarboxamide synthase